MSYMMGATGGAGTATLLEQLDSPPVFCGVRVAQSFGIVFCRLLFDCLNFWPLYCLSFLSAY